MGKNDGFELQCDSCSADLSNLVSVRCAECVEEYDLCVPCFAKGAATKEHKPWHDYVVIEQQAYPIFTNDWGADEEILMIEGMEQFGIGSWQDVADHIGRRSKEEVEQHYTDVYLNSPSYPVPIVRDHPLLGDMGVFMEQRRKRLEVFNAQQQLIRTATPQQKESLASIPACHEIQGYMPGRLEFETEAENDAETVIKNMIFEPEDSKLDVEQKLTALEIYNSRLERRTERKRTILSHSLLEYRKLAAADKKRTKDERDLFNKLKAYVRVLNEDEYNCFTEDVVNEQVYRQRIAELQEYRQNGIKTLDQANKYEKEKQTRHNLIFRTSQAPAPPRHSFFEADAQHRALYAGARNGENGASSNTNGHLPEDEPLTFKIRKMNGVAPLNVSHSADIDLLSPQEKSLCTQLRIQPKAYLAIKEFAFQYMLKTGTGMKRKTMRDVFHHIDEQRVGRLYDFFLSQKWTD